MFYDKYRMTNHILSSALLTCHDTMVSKKCQKWQSHQKWKLLWETKQFLLKYCEKQSKFLLEYCEKQSKSYSNIVRNKAIPTRILLETKQFLLEYYEKQSNSH